MKRVEKIFIEIWVICVIIVVIFMAIQKLIGIPNYASTARVDSLKMCGITYTNSGIPQKVNICGDVYVDGVASLGIYLYKMPEHQFISVNPPDDHFYQGSFSRELNLSENDPFGEYKVEIYLYRELLVSAEIQVK